MPKVLSEKAAAIWGKLGENERANAATTIAVSLATNGEYYCTANDVGAVSKEAIAEAKAQGISTIGEDYISRAGIGLHAEMWAIQQALCASASPKEVLQKVGASRACCKYCSAVLTHVEVQMDTSSEDLYKSWVNPLTTADDGKPRKDYAKQQRKAIPDYRIHSTDSWYADSKGTLTRDPQGT